MMTTVLELSASSYQIPRDICVLALQGAVKEVYQILAKKPLRVKDIQLVSHYSGRTIVTALRTLEDIGLIYHYDDMMDLRSKRYAHSG